MDKQFFNGQRDKYKIMGNKVIGLPGPFKLDLPEIYQIEISSICNYNCVMCPRELYNRRKDEKFIDPKIIERMIDRKEFDGSYFVELQLSGEPLLHPQIQYIISLLKETGVLVGLSTNGSLLTQDFVDKNLNHLDYITISLDSVTKRHEIRKGFKQTFEDWYEQNLRDSIYQLNLQGSTVDIQFVELPGYQDEMAKFYELAIDIMPIVNVRTIPEAYFTLVHKGTYPHPDKGMCMNPFSSVSIQSQGHVVACCFCFGDDIFYGDIKEQTLQEIWEGPLVSNLRCAHRFGREFGVKPNDTICVLPEICKRCYFRSPTLLHTNILFKSIRGQKKEWSI